MFWFILFNIILVIDLIICPIQVIGPKKLRSSSIFGTNVVIILAISRFLIIMFDPSFYILPFYLNLIIGIPVFLLGTIIISIALIKMKIYSLSGTTEGEPLNTDGIYGKVRHPIYLGEILWPIGLVIIMMKIYSILMVIGMIIYFIFYTRLEERKLLKIHGEFYMKYQQQVPMLFPLRLKKQKL